MIKLDAINVDTTWKNRAEGNSSAVLLEDTHYQRHLEKGPTNRVSL